MCKLILITAFTLLLAACAQPMDDPGVLRAKATVEMAQGDARAAQLIATANTIENQRAQATRQQREIDQAATSTAQALQTTATAIAAQATQLAIPTSTPTPAPTDTATPVPPTAIPSQTPAPVVQVIVAAPTSTESRSISTPPAVTAMPSARTWLLVGVLMAAGAAIMGGFWWMGRTKTTIEPNEEAANKPKP